VAQVAVGESSIPSCQVCLSFLFFWALSQVTSPTPDIRRRRRRHLLFGRRVAGPGVLRWSLSLTTGMSMRVCLLYTNKYLLIREREEVGMVDFYGIAQERKRVCCWPIMSAQVCISHRARNFSFIHTHTDTSADVWSCNNIKCFVFPLRLCWLQHTWAVCVCITAVGFPPCRTHTHLCVMSVAYNIPSSYFLISLTSRFFWFPSQKITNLFIFCFLNYK
jgi:hypothetical protein